MITIVDYGMGNLRSVANALKFLGCDTLITSDPNTVVGADRVILPGVGAFGAAMDNMHKSGLDDAVKTFISSQRPFLGICLGMQLLMEKSDENGFYKGLGIIKGRVVKFDDASLKIPQIGWNLLDIKKPSPIFCDTKPSDRVYFVHSHYVVCYDHAMVAAVTNYGCDYCSSIWKDNIYATQFHPEKSGEVGLCMLKHFAEGK